MKHPIVIFIAGVILGGVGAWVHIHSTTTDITDTFAQEITLQEARFKSLLRTTDTNDSDDVARKIINGCSSDKQQRFDTYLNDLESQSPEQLREAQALLPLCGDVIASYKAYMVSKLQRELEQLTSLIKLNEKLAGEEMFSNQLPMYQDLVRLESERADSLYRFVDLQGEIIDKLLAGSTGTSDDIQALRNDVQAERETYSVLKTQIKDLSNKL